MRPRVEDEELSKRSAADTVEAAAALVISLCDGCLMPAGVCPASKNSDLSGQLGRLFEKPLAAFLLLAPCANPIRIEN